MNSELNLTEEYFSESVVEKKQGDVTTNGHSIDSDASWHSSTTA